MQSKERTSGFPRPTVGLCAKHRNGSRSRVQLRGTRIVDSTEQRDHIASIQRGVSYTLYLWYLYFIQYALHELSCDRGENLWQLSLDLDCHHAKMEQGSILWFQRLTTTCLSGNSWTGLRPHFVSSVIICIFSSFCFLLKFWNDLGHSRRTWIVEGDQIKEKPRLCVTNLVIRYSLINEVHHSPISSKLPKNAIHY
jgi:hypothetical protein